MSNIQKTLLFSIVLIVISAISVSIRAMLDDSDQLPPGDSIWELHWDFTLEESIPESIVRMATPIDSKNAQVFEQNISLRGLRIRRSRLSADGTREIVAKVTQAEDVAISANFAVRLSPIGIPHFTEKKDVLNTERRQLYLSNDEKIPAKHNIIKSLLSDITKDVQGTKSIVKALFNYCNQEIKTSDNDGFDDVLKILDKGGGSTLGNARLFVTLSRAANIPSRIVMGMILEEASRVTPHYWVETNINGKWLAFDPSKGYEQELPYNYLAVRKNGEGFFNLPGTMLLDLSSIEINQRDVTVGLFIGLEKSLGDILDLNRLSLSTRLTLAFLLLLPLGALFTVFVRQIIGPEVYGIFTPTFLAMAFSHVGWITGGILLFLVTVVGVIGRSFTPRLGLNRTSRLTIVFILVAITMIFSVSLMVYYGIVPDGSIVLLPIVILTFMIDRIYRLADSDGVKVAITRLYWTLVVSAIVVSILQMNTVGLWLLKYPEAHLVTVALVILISLYKGEKWMVIIGLGFMLEPKKTTKTHSDVDIKPG